VEFLHTLDEWYTPCEATHYMWLEWTSTPPWLHHEWRDGWMDGWMDDKWSGYCSLLGSSSLPNQSGTHPVPVWFWFWSRLLRSGPELKVKPESLLKNRSQGPLKECNQIIIKYFKYSTIIILKNVIDYFLLVKWVQCLCLSFSLFPNPLPTPPLLWSHMVLYVSSHLSCPCICPKRG